MEFNKKTFSSQANFHLAGIIPIAGQPLDFNMPYPDSLLPVAPDYTMIEAAVVEAAMVGCNTIWIVCNDDIEPIIRYRVGDYIQDPVHFYNNFDPIPTDRRIRIPIFWVPIHPKDRDKRDCLSWSVLHGAITSFKISHKISKWIAPDKYYVSFPYGIFDPRPLQKLRSKIKNKNNFYVVSDGEAVMDNHYTSFTFGKDEFVRYRRNIRKATGLYSSDVKDDRGIPRSRLPIEKRWSARFFEPKDVFSGSLDGAYTYIAEDYHNINTWDSYREYLKSDLSDKIQRPTRELFSYREFNGVAIDRS